MHFEIKEPPCDGITSLDFSKEQTDLLACSSWDKTIRLYDVSSNIPKGTIKLESSLLSCIFLQSCSSNETVICACVDGCVTEIDLEKQTSFIFGKHQKGVKCLSINEPDSIFSGGWDKRIFLWDKKEKKNKLIANLPEKIYSMDCIGNYLVVGMSNRLVYVFDKRKTDLPFQKRESSLKYQTRCVKCLPDGTGFVSSSIEGRIAVDFFNEDISNSMKYAFKCHRTKSIKEGERIDIAHPIHSLIFIRNNILLSGGADGTVNIWDIIQKKRIKMIQQCPSSISSLSFSQKTNTVAISSSYCYEEGKKEHPPDSIFIRKIGEEELCL